MQAREDINPERLSFTMTSRCRDSASYTQMQSRKEIPHADEFQPCRLNNKNEPTKKFHNTSTSTWKCSYLGLSLLIQSCKFPLLRSRKSKKVCADLAHLDLLCTLCNTVAAEVSVYMFKRVLPRVAITAMNLPSQLRHPPKRRGNVPE